MSNIVNLFHFLILKILYYKTLFKIRIIIKNQNFNKKTIYINTFLIIILLVYQQFKFTITTIIFCIFNI